MCEKTDKLGEASSKFSEIIAFLDELENCESEINAYGKIRFSEGHKGTVDDPVIAPHMEYADMLSGLIKAVYRFNKDNPDYDLGNYQEIMEQNGIKHLDEINTEGLDSVATMAALFGIIRQERFCDGLIRACLKKVLCRN